jgi:exonuclease VII small subunit
MNAERREDKVMRDEDAVEHLSYMEASRELDEIVGFFERSEVDVDQLVARLERATTIVDELDRRIRRTRAQVEELVPKLEAAGRTAVAGQAPGAGEAEMGDDEDGASGAIDSDHDAEEETLPF